MLNKKFKRCFTTKYYESCKIAKQIADDQFSTCDDMD